MHAPPTQLPLSQTVPHTPQLSGSVASVTSHPSAAFMLQSAKPSSQWKLHVSAMQTARAPAGVGQTAHAGPHAAGSVFAAQAAPQRWNPGSHVVAHAPAVHAAVPF